MKNALFLGLGLALLAGCGGEAAEDDWSDASPSPTEEAPYTEVVDVNAYPENGAKGVLIHEPIVLAFSHSMNVQSVRDAWTSDHLPLDSLKVTWSEDLTVMEIDASEVLAYPQGDMDVDPYDYAFTIDSRAESLTGFPLTTPLTHSFQTARDIKLTLSGLEAGTGAHNGYGQSATIRIGDDELEETWRGFLSVDISTLPTVVEIQSASLFARQTDLTGHPYVDLGNIMIGHIDPITDGIAPEDVDVAAMPLGRFSNSDAVANPGGDRAADISPGLLLDLEAGHQISSYRLEFQAYFDDEGDDDLAIFDRTSVRLDLHLLVE